MYPTLEDAKEAVYQAMAAKAESLKAKNAAITNGWLLVAIRTASSMCECPT
jgi:hypothetical protein